MKLKKLQIKGFKSFANETTIHFNDEIIGIVGPNGSGKSNIVDSIRWVLGEQKSKDLRLEKMVDVIFNGTKSKKKAGMASVSMTFDNTKKLIPLEYDQVKVSRILYDTNESEYRINDVTCRLRDIRDLFLNTGIGSNSYAIIELGMVDDILLDKDHARRKMFEQAAGISKYKIRKRETLLKLKNTQADLDRIEDILFELTSNLKSLERQAKRTKKYYELKETYKELSIKRIVISQKESIATEQKLKAELAVLQESFAGLSGEIHTLEAEIEKTKKLNLESEQMLSEKQREFNDIIEGIRSHENQQDIERQNKSFTQQNIVRVENNQKEYLASIERIQKELDERSSNLKILSEEAVGLKSEFDMWKAKYEQIEAKRLNIQGENKSDIDELKDLEDRRFDIEKSIIEINSQSAHYASNRQGNTKLIEETSATLAQYEASSTSLTEEIINVETGIEDLDGKKNKLESERERLQGEMEEMIQRRIALNRKSDALANEIKLLSDMENNLEGFPDSGKFLLKQWKADKPILSDIINCADEYRSTIETFLEPYLNYFVLDNVEEARSSIKLLQEAQKGKSKFFIMSSFHDMPNQQILFDHLGIPALSVVTAESKYIPLVNHLLENVVIVENQKVLEDEFPNEDVVYLSKDGVANRTRHIISGGSIGLFDGKRIGRKSEIEKLQKQQKELEAQLKQIVSDLTRKEEALSALAQEDLDALIAEKMRQKTQLEIQRAELVARSTNAAEQLEKLKNAIADFDLQTKENEQKVSDLKDQLGVLIKTIEDKKQMISSQSGQIEEIAQSFGVISGKYNQAQLSYVKNQNETESFTKEIEYRKAQLAELQEKRQSADGEVENLKDKFAHTEKMLANLKEQLINSYNTRDTKQKELGETEQTFFTKRSLINDKEESLKRLNKKHQESQLNINDKKDKLTGLGFELRSSMERLKIEFNVEFKDIDTEGVVADVEDIGTLIQKYEKVKRRLDNYGEINPMAVEAYDEIQERFTSMEAQRDDILAARTSLNETIAEIDADATEKFLEAFYKVKDNFKEVFRSLFSDEDDCDLVLFNPTNPLESDIEIVAKPKGKRPKVLSQLSGGEKTLTATALLFSLYLLRPAPFCIFDEVDAPLDDVNIQKFSRLIRRFSDESQFIIITHNKSTMANVDLLYGVYMQEQGVSGITEVDFREYEHSEVFQKVNLN